MTDNVHLCHFFVYFVDLSKATLLHYSTTTTADSVIAYKQPPTQSRLNQKKENLTIPAE
jgi:hypothetical protein